MIITRTPFRVSFFGGGTDYPNWYKEHGGAVLNTTINKYCYIMLRYLPPFLKYKYSIRYRISEKRNSIDTIQHPTVRECLNFMNVERGIELVHTADLPARSGLGSSSAFTVCFLQALNAISGKLITKRQLALDAIHIEQNLVQENIGSQDQTAASFGGINRIDFGNNNIVSVKPIILRDEFIQELQGSLMLFFTGFSRTASEIAGCYVPNLPKHNKQELESMYQLVSEAEKVLYENNIEKFGKLMHESWQLKKTFSGKISNFEIDAIYETALRNGAIGGKLCGAGGGGFLLLVVPKERQNSVRNALKKLLLVPIKFDFLGSQIIMYHQQDY